jgi:chromosome segregation ATPase
LSQQNVSTSATYNQLNARAQKLETSLAEEAKHVSQLSSELSATKQELDHYRANNAQLARHNQDLEKEVDSVRNRLHNMESKEKEREETSRRLENILTGTNEQRAKLEETVEMYRIQNSKLDESLKKAMEEISKVW